MSERPKKKRIRRLRMVMNAILILVLLLAGGAAGVYFLCGIEDVTLSGTDKYTAEEVRAYVLNNTYANDNTVLAWAYSRVHPRRDIPFLSQVTVEITGMNSLNFSAEETDYAGYFTLSDGRMTAYFDKNGYITDVSERFFPKGPQLLGLTVTGAGIGDPLPMEDTGRKTVVRLLDSLQEQKLEAQSITVSESGELSLTLNSVMVSLGTRINLEQKVARLPQILEKLRERGGSEVSGILHMETWTPESTDIIFEEGDPAQLLQAAAERSQMEVNTDRTPEPDAEEGEDGESAEGDEEGEADE